MSSWGWESKFTNLRQVGDFSIFGSKNSQIQGVILKIILALVFNFRLGIYNPFGVQRHKPYDEREARVVMGQTGGAGRTVNKSVLQFSS